MKLSIKDISETLVSVSKIISICIGVGIFLLKLYDGYIERFIEIKNSKIIERVIMLEEFDRARYLTLIDNTYSLLKSGHTVAISELEFVIKFRTKFLIDNKIVEMKLDYIYNDYLDRIK